MLRHLPYVLLFSAAACAAAPSYSAKKIDSNGIETVHLTDSSRGIEVAIVPSIGNRAYQWTVHGQNLLYFPLAGPEDLKTSPQSFNGIPFLAPWANRLTESGFWAGGQFFRLNTGIGTVHLDSNGITMHGMLTVSSLWEVVDIGADEHSAHVTSRLRFWKYPDLMANWPFAQEYRMTYALADGVVTVTTEVMNLSTAPMPVAIGFHPYFQIPGVPRSKWTAHIAAREHVETDRRLIPTGERKPFNGEAAVSLSDHTFDDGFTDLIRASDGEATFSVQSGGKKIEVVYGPKYQVAVVYAPPGKDFICFEPMAAITDGINLAHEGKYPELQTVAPGATWTESFQIRASGF